MRYAVIPSAPLRDIKTIIKKTIPCREFRRDYYQQKLEKTVVTDF